MKTQLTTDDVLRRMEEADLIRNIDKGGEYTGFKGLYGTLIKKGLISKEGHVYDVSKHKDSRHILDFLQSIENEEPLDVVMTSGSFLSMNKKLQRQVASYLMSLSKKGSVRLYVGEDVTKLFKNSDVRVNLFNREKHFIPHFIKTKTQFNFVLPHTEIKLIRVDLNSKMFDVEGRNGILNYFDDLIANFDNAIKND